MRKWVGSWNAREEAKTSPHYYGGGTPVKRGGLVLGLSGSASGAKASSPAKAGDYDEHGDQNAPEDTRTMPGGRHRHEGGRSQRASHEHRRRHRDDRLAKPPDHDSVALSGIDEQAMKWNHDDSTFKSQLIAHNS